MSQRHRRTGFSAMELMLLVSIGFIGLGLVVPALHRARAAQGERETINHLKMMALACHNCNDSYRKLPPAYDTFPPATVPASVHVYLLPFLEQDQLYKKFLDDKKIPEVKVDAFVSPEDPSSAKKELAGIQNLAANLRVFANKGFQTKHDADMGELGKTEPGNASIPRSFLDGTSNTILFTTKYGFCGADGGSRYAAAPNTTSAAFFGQNAAKVKAHPSDKTATFQLRPEAKDCCASPLMAQSFSRTGIQVGIADGSVRTLSPMLTPSTWNAAVQPNDGMVLGPDWSN